MFNDSVRVSNQHKQGLQTTSLETCKGQDLQRPTSQHQVRFWLTSSFPEGQSDSDRCRQGPYWRGRLPGGRMDHRWAFLARNLSTKILQAVDLEVKLCSVATRLSLKTKKSVSYSCFEKEQLHRLPVVDSLPHLAIGRLFLQWLVGPHFQQVPLTLRLIPGTVPQNRQEAFEYHSPSSWSFESSRYNMILQQWTTRRIVTGLRQCSKFVFKIISWMQGVQKMITVAINKNAEVPDSVGDILADSLIAQSLDLPPKAAKVLSLGEKMLSFLYHTFTSLLYNISLACIILASKSL